MKIKSLYYLFGSIVLCGLILFIKKRNSSSYKKMLIENIGADVPTLHPHKIDDGVSWRVSNDIYEGLVEYDHDFKLVLSGAESYTVSDDNKTYIFNLRKDAKWANGDDVTAEDYVFSLRLCVNPLTLGQSYLENVLVIKNAAKIVKGNINPSELGVYADSKYVLRFELESPNCEFLDYLTLPIFLPIHKATYDKFGLSTFASIDGIVGNGPYKIVSWVRNNYMVLIKNDNYWNKDNINIERIKFLMIEDGATDLNTFRTGHEHISNINIPIMSKADYEKEFGDKYKRNNVLYQLRLLFNFKNEKFSDIRVRKALYIGTNRNKISKVVLKDATPAYTIVHEEISNNEFKDDINNFTEFDWMKMDSTELQSYACDLLRQAGYSEKNPLKITLLSDSGSFFKNISTALQANFNDDFKGLVVCKVEFVDWKTFLDRMSKMQYEIINTRWICDYNLPSNFTSLYIGNSQTNYSAYKNPKYDFLYYGSIVSPDKDTYFKFQHECNKIATCEFASIPYSLFYYQRLVSDEIDGYYTNNNILGRYSTKYVRFKDTKK